MRQHRVLLQNIPLVISVVSGRLDVVRWLFVVVGSGFMLAIALKYQTPAIWHLPRQQAPSALDLSTLRGHRGRHRTRGWLVDSLRSTENYGLRSQAWECGWTGPKGNSGSSLQERKTFLEQKVTFFLVCRSRYLNSYHQQMGGGKCLVT